MPSVHRATDAECIGPIDETPRVLVVEDHSLVAEGLVFALAQAGVHAEIVQWDEPAQVVENVGVGPGLVLLDLDLGPDVAGERLVAPLCERGFTVVVLTAVTDRIRLAVCLEAGAIAVAEKSESFDDVLDVVQRALDGKHVTGTRVREELLDELRRHRTDMARRHAPFMRLSPRERELLAAILHGKQPAAIAVEWGVSLKTVRAQTSSVLQKLGVHSQLAAVALARSAEWNGNSSIDPMR